LICTKHHVVLVISTTQYTASLAKNGKDDRSAHQMMLRFHTHYTITIKTQLPADCSQQHYRSNKTNHSQFICAGS